MDGDEIRRTEIVTYGYHGTNVKNANSILINGYLIGKNENLRLGNGAYFYEMSYAHAYDWAAKWFIDSEITVLVSKIKLGKCLNLTDAEHVEMVQIVSESIRKKLSGKRIKVTDALVINYIADFSNPDSVKCAFTNPNSKKIFKESKLVEYQQIVICVRNLKNILQTERA